MADDDGADGKIPLLVGILGGALVVGLELVARRGRSRPVASENAATSTETGAKARRGEIEAETRDQPLREKSARPAQRRVDYNEDALPPPSEDATVHSHYFVTTGGWGHVTALSLTCKSCGFDYTAQTSGLRSREPLPRIDATKVWMRKRCPLGEGSCKV